MLLSGYAEPLQPTSDVPSVWRCTLCTYECASKSALSCHEVAGHGVFTEVSRCINTPWCSVCGFRFETIVCASAHVQDKSPLCKLNLLLRGPFLTDEQHVDVLAAIATSRTKNIRSGVHKHKISKLCVRMFGPHRGVVDHDGTVVKASRKGHPLGNNRQLHLPPHLLVQVPRLYLPWQASRYTACTAACLLCGEGARDSVT